MLIAAALGATRAHNGEPNRAYYSKIMEFIVSRAVYCLDVYVCNALLQQSNLGYLLCCRRLMGCLLSLRLLRTLSTFHSI